MSTPAARICGPPMPKISISARCFRAVARRAAYMSPLASPAERRSEGRITAANLARLGHLAEKGRSNAATLLGTWLGWVGRSREDGHGSRAPTGRAADILGMRGGMR